VNGPLVENGGTLRHLGRRPGGERLRRDEADEWPPLLVFGVIPKPAVGVVRDPDVQQQGRIVVEPVEGRALGGFSRHSASRGDTAASAPAGLAARLAHASAGGHGVGILGGVLVPVWAV